jgi:hypothetical protein
MKPLRKVRWIPDDMRRPIAWGRAAVNATEGAAVDRGQPARLDTDS